MWSRNRIGSSSFNSLSRQFPGSTEREAARLFAQKYRYVGIVKYKSNPDGPYTDIGCCDIAVKIRLYLESPHCHDAVVLYEA